jgi:hypothetical protein
MTDSSGNKYPEPKFSLWFNCQREDGQDKYWAVSEIPIDQIVKLYEFAMDSENTVEGYNGALSVKIRAKMMPAQAKSGNNYMKMVISDYQPKPETEAF